MTTLVDFLLEELRTLYHSETQLVATLPLWAQRATVPGLREAFEQQIEATKEQILRLERIFVMLGKQPEAKGCEVVSDLLRGEAELWSDGSDPTASDETLVNMAQKVGHYEIASYGYLYTYAQFLGLREVGELLAFSLEEETEAAQTLAEIADREGFSATQAAA